MEENKELNMEEMDQASGGWEYQSDKYQTWLNGYNVKCPHCGSEDKDVVERKGASPSEVFFVCNNCVRSFVLRYDRLNKKIKLIAY